jgi:putative transposase
MPRGPRIDAQGVVHHVIARGIERGKIFRKDNDREDFLERLEIVTQGDKAFVYAWSLIPNHFHLAIRTGTDSLSTIMRRLMTGYAVAFNRRYKRHGHLFQNRFKSIVVDDEAYLLGLVRYIHHNPLRSGLVRSVGELARYPWTGHAALMGNADCPFQDTEEILGRFGRRMSSARKHLSEFMSDLKAARREEHLFKGGGLIRSAGGVEQLQKTPKDERQLYDERILGDGQFVQAMLEKTGIQSQPLLMSEPQRKTKFAELLERVCKEYKAQPKSLRSGSRMKSVAQARVVVAYVAGRYLEWNGIDLARELGVSASAISRCQTKGEQEIRRKGLDIEVLLK